MAYGYDLYGRSVYGPNYDPFAGVYSLSFTEPAKPKVAAKVAAPAFKAGDKVKVTIETEATVGYVFTSGTFADLTLADGFKMGKVPLKFAKLADPENWPPKVGHAWKTPDGKAFGVRDHAWNNEVVVYQVDNTANTFNASGDTNRKLDDFKKLRPILIS